MNASLLEQPANRATFCLLKAVSYFFLRRSFSIAMLYFILSIGRSYSREQSSLPPRSVDSSVCIAITRIALLVRFNRSFLTIALPMLSLV